MAVMIQTHLFDVSDQFLLVLVVVSYMGHPDVHLPHQIIEGKTTRREEKE